MSSREVWFRRSMIRGFGVAHWKGPLFIAAFSMITVIGGLFALANEAQPVLAILGILSAVTSLTVGFYICHLHTTDD